MSFPGSAHTRITSPILLVCDRWGKVQAASSIGAGNELWDVSSREQNLDDLFGADSAVNRWLQDRMLGARERDEFSAKTSMQNGDSRIFIKLESLREGREIYGFALQVLPLAADGTRRMLMDGDIIVERRQWHEIKNHVGALKLYATFLKRKMPQGDERQTVEKIINGVNALISYLDKIRRGEAP